MAASGTRPPQRTCLMKPHDFPSDTSSKACQTIFRVPLKVGLPSQTDRSNWWTEMNGKPAGDHSWGFLIPLIDADEHSWKNPLAVHSIDGTVLRADSLGISGYQCSFVVNHRFQNDPQYEPSPHRPPRFHAPSRAYRSLRVRLVPIGLPTSSRDRTTASPSLLRLPRPHGDDERGRLQPALL